MTSEQAITKLRALYDDVRQVEAEVFCVHENKVMTLYRLNDGILERRVDVDYHTCIWEEVA